MADLDHSLDSQFLLKLRNAAFQDFSQSPNTSMQEFYHQTTESPVANAVGGTTQLRGAGGSHPSDYAVQERANPRRVSNLTQHPIPRLAPSKTLPALPATADEPPARRTRMYKSFNGFSDAGGDTQPLDTQVYNQFSSKAELGAVEHDPYDDTYLGDYTEEFGEGGSFHTGDPGHIDLVKNWEETEGLDQSSDYEGDCIEELSPATQSRVRSASRMDDSPAKTPRLLPEKTPKTPATAGVKRNRRGEAVSSASRTPGSVLTSFFPGGTGDAVMSLTQVFNATQVQTSPLPEVPRSDPVFQRPSPNFANAARSTSLFLTSSPTKLQRSDPTRAITEPRDTYVTMRESQELREKRRREDDELQRLSSDVRDEFDDELAATEDAITRRKLRVQTKAQALKDFATLRAPVRPNSRRKRNSRLLSSDSSFTTPMRSTRMARGIVVSDGVQDDEEATSAAWENELGAEEPPRSQHILSQDSKMDTGVEIPATSSRPATSTRQGSQDSLPSPRTGADLTARQRSHRRSAGGQGFEGPAEPDAQPHRRTPTIAIADSQLEDMRDSTPMPRPAVPSSNSRVLQSQLSIGSSIGPSQAEAKLLQALATSSVVRPPLDTSQLNLEEEFSRMPSSPPLLPQNSQQSGLRQLHGGEDSEDEDENRQHLEAIPALKHGCGDDVQVSSHGLDTDVVQRARMIQSTILETDPADEPESTRFEAPGAAPATADSQDRDTSAAAIGAPTAASANDSSNGKPFETAQTHLSVSQQKPQSSQLSSLSVHSGKSPRIRKLAEIAADPSQHDPLGDIDMNIDIMTKEDEEFAALMSRSPPARPSKRRRMLGNATRGTPQGRKMKHLTASPESSLHPPSPSPRPVQSPEHDTLAPLVEQPPLAEACVQRKGRLHQALRKGRSSAKAALPSEIAERSNSAAPQPELEIAETPRSKQSDAIPSGSRASVNVPVRSDSNRTPPEATPEPGATETEQAAEVEEDAGTTVPESTLGSRHHTPAGTAAGDVIAPSRALALFRGGKNYFFPATCLGIVDVDGSARYKIRFEDGTEDMLEPNHIKSLDLRLGDQVKVDKDKMRQKTYIVAGFKNKISPAECSGLPPTDIRGYKTLVLEPKLRESLPDNAIPRTNERVEEAISVIYLSVTLWNKLKDRTYRHPSEADPAGGITDTLSMATSAPPTPRSRRQNMSFGTSMIRTPSVVSVLQESGLFLGMTFAVSFSSEQASQRDEIGTLIRAQGGRILDPGFDQLFTPPEVEGHRSSALKSPKKSRAGSVDMASSEASPSFALVPEAASFGFAAVIADDYSRRTKYMQALALGLPCLAARWIRDCVSAGTVLPFAKYLLPAGRSDFLDGVVRSRVLVPFDPATARLSDIIERRQLLFAGKSVLLVMGKGRAEEKNRPFLFLSWALGAQRLAKVRDLADVKSLLGKDPSWDLVFVNGDPSDAGRELWGTSDAAAEEQPQPKPGRGRKRKRAPNSAAEGHNAATTTERKAKVVGSEYIVQSLILQALLDE